MDIISEKKQQKLNTVTEAAMNYLKNMDYKEIRVEDIAKQAGMSKSTLFYYFESKGALYLDVYNKLYKQALIRFSEALKGYDILDENDFEAFIMETTHIAIHEFFPLIKLRVDLDQIFYDCSPERVTESNKIINNQRAAYNREILTKTNVFHDMELSYIINTQFLILEACYKQAMRSYKYGQGQKKYLFYETVSIFEYRSVRMLKFFIGGMLYEKLAPTHKKNENTLLREGNAEE